MFEIALISCWGRFVSDLGSVWSGGTGESKADLVEPARGSKGHREPLRVTQTSMASAVSESRGTLRVRQGQPDRRAAKSKSLLLMPKNSQYMSII